MSGFVHIDGARFLMGSDRFYPEEGPVHEESVVSFSIAPFAVTNHEFAEFVDATGYISVAERSLNLADFPEANLESVEPGSLVFTATAGPVDLDEWRQWWRWVPGADWRHPTGPGSDLTGLDDHPVVQVAYEDATAFAAWAGARLPTETEWEYASRGGLVAATFSWGEGLNDGSKANTWLGAFPYENVRASGEPLTAPVGSYPPNGFGLFDMTGNTWEWTSTIWSDSHDAHCMPGAHHEMDNHELVSRVLKGGSHLCAPEYCLRYRPAARSAQAESSAATHIGFRIARD